MVQVRKGKGSCSSMLLGLLNSASQNPGGGWDLLEHHIHADRGAQVRDAQSTAYLASHMRSSGLLFPLGQSLGSAHLVPLRWGWR